MGNNLPNNDGWRRDRGVTVTVTANLSRSVPDPPTVAQPQREGTLRDALRI